MMGTSLARTAVTFEPRNARSSAASLRFNRLTAGALGLTGIHRVGFGVAGFRLVWRKVGGAPGGLSVLGWRWKVGGGARRRGWPGDGGCRQADADPGGSWVLQRLRWTVRLGTARSEAGPAPAGTGVPRASGWAGAGASVGRSGAVGRAGLGSGSAGSWWSSAAHPARC